MNLCCALPRVDRANDAKGEVVPVGRQRCNLACTRAPVIESCRRALDPVILTAERLLRAVGGMIFAWGAVALPSRTMRADMQKAAGGNVEGAST
jgi:hypothetical protein